MHARLGPLLLALVALALHFGHTVAAAPTLPTSLPSSTEVRVSAELNRLVENSAALEPVTAPDPIVAAQRQDRLTLLLVGIDRRPDEDLFRTDTLMLATLDLREGRASLLSIPRDLVVSIPGYGNERVNAAYAIGETGRPGSGVSLLRETIKRNFGTQVDHHVLVDFACFSGTVDAIGGVTLDVPIRVVDPHFPTDDYGYKRISFEPGRQHLDGERALEYIRTRHADSDFGRMRRQQQFLLAFREQALHPRNLGALPRVTQACSRMSSDLSLSELVSLGLAARGISPASISMLTIDERLAAPHTAPSGAQVLLPRWKEIRALVQGRPPSAAAAAPTG
jgi:polyisoprenyl-teichoic acid--peptidoglycan teichoic acid transferase